MLVARDSRGRAHLDRLPGRKVLTCNHDEVLELPDGVNLTATTRGVRVFQGPARTGIRGR